MENQTPREKEKSRKSEGGQNPNRQQEGKGMSQERGKEPMRGAPSDDRQKR